MRRRSCCGFQRADEILNHSLGKSREERMLRQRPRIAAFLVAAMGFGGCVPHPELTDEVLLTETYGPAVCAGIGGRFNIHAQLQAEIGSYGLRAIDYSVSALRLVELLEPVELPNPRSNHILCGFWMLVEQSQYYRYGWSLPLGPGPFKYSLIYEGWFSFSVAEGNFAVDRACIGKNRLGAYHNPSENHTGIIPSKIPPLEGVRRVLPSCFTANGESDGYL